MIWSAHPVAHPGRSRSPRSLTRTALTVVAAASQLPAAAAPGDTSADTTVANVAVNSAITLEGLTPSFTLTGIPGASVAEAGAVAYTVLTNNVGGYVVNVQAAAPELAPAGPSPDTIPVGNLQVRPTGNGAYTSLTDASPITLHTKGSRSVEAGDPYTDDYRVDIPFVADDVYSVTLNYIATAS